MKDWTPNFLTLQQLRAPSEKHLSAVIYELHSFLFDALRETSNKVTFSISIQLLFILFPENDRKPFRGITTWALVYNGTKHV